MTKEELKKKMQTGDFLTLAKMLGIDNPDAARKRFNREDPRSLAAMETIITEREKLINGHSN